MEDVIAHRYRNRDGVYVTQSLEEHSANVAQMSSKLAEGAGLGAVSYLIGLMHDCGKSSQEFQDYISGEGKKSDKGHAKPGGRVVACMIDETPSSSRQKDLLKELVTVAIASHHTGLPAWCMSDFEEIVPDGEIKEYLNEHYDRNEFKELYQNALDDFEKSRSKCIEKIKLAFSSDANLKNKGRELLQYIWGMYCRFLLSCQIDADWYDTSIFFDKNKQTDVEKEVTWDEIQRCFELKLSEFKADSDINIIRSRISQMAYDNANNPVGCFALAVPTGTGKTLASFRFALQHAKVNNLKRIIYVIPYCSIIEQTANVIRDFLNHSCDDIILEDHSRSTIFEDSESDVNNYTRKIIAERWDCKIIITTAVQYLNIYYSNINKFTRKLNKLSSSVVIFDEIQAIPNKCRQLFNLSVNFLTMTLRSSALICSATIPARCNDIIEVPNTHNLCNEAEFNLKNNNLFNRVEIINHLGNVGRGGSSRTPEYIAELAISNMNELGNCLVIANLKKQVRNIYKSLLEIIDNKGLDNIKTYFLSGDLCPKHRYDVLAEINNDLKTKKRVILISTQLIEAGVDIDFNSVIRVVAGADSIIQSAGRCNRNGMLRDSDGKMILGKVYIVDYLKQEHDFGHKSVEDIYKGIEISEKLLRCDEFSKTINIDSFLKKYYDEFNHRFKDAYQFYYEDVEKHTIDYLLTEIPSEDNKNLDKNFCKAGAEFEVINNDSQYSLFVDYDNFSVEIFQKFKEVMELRDFSLAKKIRRQLSLYEIAVSNTVYKNENIKIKDTYEEYKLIDYATYEQIIKGM
ncbi:MAG: CRISPR-associated helicase Cas3' [Succinimonas sp.]|nr:CRISPR-associated helicase Cas3' [Succinimonas sp.]